MNMRSIIQKPLSWAMVGIFALLCGATSAHAQAMAGQYMGSDRLLSNQTLWVYGMASQAWNCAYWSGSNPSNQSQYIMSQDKASQFFAQTDGNLVVYGGTRAQWALYPRTNYSLPSGAIPTGRGTVMQCDGNFVYYQFYNFAQSDPRWVGNGAYSLALWDSGTWGHPGAFLVMQNGGNLVIRDANGTALWWLNMPGGSGFKFVG